MTKNILGLRIALVLITTGLLFTATGCDESLKMAVGNDDEIFVVADSAEFVELEPVLLQVFGQKIYTPQPETLFNLTHKNLNELEKVKNKKNVILIAPLNSGSDVSDYITAMLDSTVESMVREGKEFVFNKYDLWRKYQLAMILTAPTVEELKMKLLQNDEELIYYFQKISDKRLKRSLYSPKYEKQDIQGHLLKEYDWTIYVQADFHLALEDKENNFVWLRRAPGSDMERWIFVHWIENASPEFLTQDSIIAERNKMTEKFYRTSDDKYHVEIADIYKTREVNFRDNYALMTEGLWRMSDNMMGGYFVNYTFYDEKSGRIYMLDGSIYAPKYYKKNLIQQVDVMLQSFRTRDELSEDRIEDLLEEVE